MSAVPHPHAVPRLSRRTLLATGAGVALASTAAGRLLLRGDGAPGLAVLLDGPQISIGFLDRVVDRGAADLSGRPEVVPATRVAADHRLGGLATARVMGPTPRVLDEPPVAGLQLDALFADPDGGVPLRHHAWALTTDPLAASPPIRFAVPVGALSFGFALRTLPHGGAASDAAVVMTGGDERTLVGMRPGTYLLGAEAGVWDAPAHLPAVDDPAWAGLASLVISILPR